MKVGKFDYVEVLVHDLVDKFKFVKNVIYAVENYDFKYVIPTETVNSYVCGCYPCNRQGEILEGYKYPVLINSENLKNYIF